MSVRLTETALADIDEICAYIAKDNPVAAAAVAAAIERTIAAIAKRPKLAPIVHEGRVRAKLVERFQYRVFYEVRLVLRTFLIITTCPSTFGLGRGISEGRADGPAHSTTILQATFSRILRWLANHPLSRDRC